jgi:hypothetical protein
MAVVMFMVIVAAAWPVHMALGGSFRLESRRTSGRHIAVGLGPEFINRGQHFKAHGL